MLLRRASLKLSVLLSLALLLSLVQIGAPASAQPAFPDVRGSVHEPAVSALSAEGILAGCEDDRFCPDGNITRAQTATVLARALGLVELDDTRRDPDLDTRFTDTSQSVHAGAIEAIAQAGITTGCDDDRFCPNQRLTRGELSTLLTRALDVADARRGPHFTDIGGVHAPAVDALAEDGVAAGCNLVHFCPRDPLTRAQTATLIARSLDLADRIELAPLAERRAEHQAILDAEAEARAQARAEQRERERAEAEARERAEEEARRNAPAARAVETAIAQVGKPYAWGGNGPGSFDCSGLTRFAWNAAGVTIPRTSRDQHAATRRISRSELQPGDLVFYHSPVSHVAMYIGDGRVVEAPNRGNNVRISTEGLTRSGIVGYGRVR